jgi:addiction module HigA family antidote
LGTDVVHVELIADGYAAHLVQSSGNTFDIPWDLVLHHADSSYPFFAAAPAARSARGAAQERAGQIGGRVQQERLLRGWSVVEFARRLGMKPPNVTRLESGAHMPSLDTLERVASALGLPVVDLFPRTGAAAAPAATVTSHPGVVLQGRFLLPLGISQRQLARDLGVPPHRVNEIVRGRRPVNADTALRLARYFSTSAEFWLRLQVHHDLEEARRQLSSRLEREVRPRQG